MDILPRNKQQIMQVCGRALLGSDEDQAETRCTPTVKVIKKGQKMHVSQLAASKG
jgi:hypothetical protein